MNKTQTAIVVALAIIVVALLFFVGMGNNGDTQVSNNASSSDVSSQTSSITGNNEILINGQKAGKEVLVAGAFLQSPGFLAVHQDVNGQPGPVIGTSKLLEAESNEDVKISLSREVKTGERLYIAMYLDNGDTKFNSGDDSLAQDADGAPVLVGFDVQ